MKIELIFERSKNNNNVVANCHIDMTLAELASLTAEDKIKLAGKTQELKDLVLDLYEK